MQKESRSQAERIFFEANGKISYVEIAKKGGGSSPIGGQMETRR